MKLLQIICYYYSVAFGTKNKMLLLSTHIWNWNEKKIVAGMLSKQKAVAIIAILTAKFWIDK